MPKNEYDIGDIVQMSASFTNLAGSAATPGTVVCTVRAPTRGTAGAAVSGTANPYTAQVSPDEPGTWWYAFDGGPDVKASGENYFAVREQKVPR